MTMSASRISIPLLRAQARGRVVTPQDADYDELRTVVYGGHDERPAAIVRVRDDKDVARTVCVARDEGAELAVRSGGHSVLGHSTTEGGIVIDLRAMKGLEVDEPAQTAWVETGLSAAEVTSALSERGLAIGFGDTGSVGVGGITLGGGIGFLVRKFGLTIDSLLAADLVMADGRVLRVDDEHDPDRCWAIRGGGGNYGVATRVKFRLHEVPQIVGGMLFLPATAETVEAFMALAETAPEELSTIANVMNCPPMPFIPEQHHGSLVIMAFMCYAGEVEAGERALAPFRALAEPLADLVKPMPYSGMYPPAEGEYHPTAVARTMFMRHVDPATARLIVDRLAESDAPLRAVQLRVLGGAAARVADDATAYAHRSSRIMTNVASFYEGEDDRPRRQAWVDQVAASLQQGDEGAYVNFLEDEGPEALRRAYPGATLDRLVSVKRRYDPTNLFRLNHNISPGPEVDR
jgi:FAD/FMN-containing dehydrogenase